MKTIKTAISMPEDLYQTVREYAGEKPFSTTMCNLVRQALGLEKGIPVQPHVTQFSNDAIEALTYRISALETKPGIESQYIDGFDKRVASLERYVEKELEAIKSVLTVIDNTIYTEVIPDEISDQVRKLTQIGAHVTTEMDNMKRFISIEEIFPTIEETAALAPDVSEVIPDKKAPVHPDHYQGANHTEPIIITPELKEAMSNRLKGLKMSGMSYKAIFEMTGIPERSQKRIISPNLVLKSIQKSRYQALMGDAV